MSDDEPVVIHLTGSTWQFRLAAYLRGLRRPAQLLPLLVVAAFPAAIDLGVSLLGSAPASVEVHLGLAVVGLAAALTLVGLGAAVAVLRRAGPSTVSFDVQGIVEVAGGRATHHDWRWAGQVLDQRDCLTLYCAEPVRGFRLTASTHARQLVIDRTSPELERLRALCRARGLIT